MNFKNLAICFPLWLGITGTYYLLYAEHMPLWGNLTVGVVTGIFFPILKTGGDR